VEAIEGYLLDSNIISVLLRPSDQRFGAVRANLDAIRDSPIFLPVMAIAEIEFGLAVGGTSREQAKGLRDFFSEYPSHLGIDDHTVEPYALLRSQIFRDHGTPREKRRGFEQKVPEELVDRVTGQSLGIDERDLLIASVAAQYRLVFATNDQNEGMKRIERAARSLEVEGKPIRLRVEYWPKRV
jgi:predicted nucleic acid-binding protein